MLRSVDSMELHGRECHYREQNADCSLGAKQLCNLRMAPSQLAYSAWMCCFAGGRTVSTPDYPEPLRSSMTDADSQRLRRDMWPRKNVPNPTSIPHMTPAVPQPLQNSMADGEYVNLRARQ